MNCCSETSSLSPADQTKESPSGDLRDAPAVEDNPTPRCANCGRASRPVKRKTMLLMLKPDLFHRITEGRYRFCCDPECDIVYFAERGGPSFTTADLRVRVGLKEKEDPIPLCYCFGFDEQDVRREIALKGHSTIIQRIGRLVKEGMCACSTRNPSGTCCLGDVPRVLGRLYAARSVQTDDVIG